MKPPSGQAQIDDQHLRWLTWAYFIYAGLAGSRSCFFIYEMLNSMIRANTHPPEDSVQHSFILINPAPFIMLAFSALLVYCGICIGKRKLLKLILFSAGISSFLFPLGTVLGIWTFVVMLRPSVKTLFTSS